MVGWETGVCLSSASGKQTPHRAALVQQGGPQLAWLVFFPCLPFIHSGASLPSGKAAYTEATKRPATSTFSGQNKELLGSGYH